MTTFVELLDSLKDELHARYRSAFWGTSLIAILAVHWKIVVFLVIEKPSATAAIAFVEANATTMSIAGAFCFAALYVTIFPWIEYWLSKVSSYGIRARNDFQFRERERNNNRRKIIAQSEESIIGLEAKNKEEQARLSDVKLANSYQELLSGEYFTRWLKDVKNGAINSSLINSIVNYLNKYDSIEGRFIDADIARIHQQFVEALSTLHSAISDTRHHNDIAKQADLIRFADGALKEHQNYRQLVRSKLGV
ncbi:hypothetical protein [Denitratisoma oestradiolicum]|uniref:Uncharacterized protein n=1 Tax=Denitratisoma oestradiolicum TaxID=311182 RepID=A0A6S6XZ73_9PROT|nr:hypothetical protein [Denitratisoma oestradiolicum]TWO78955.1 hypothetical protein CBW56_17200 [Denitratisoma oestradiolicum]CAB1368192.1 protein of unknown function [Denitratisoma oestradiolicum]